MSERILTVVLVCTAIFLTTLLLVRVFPQSGESVTPLLPVGTQSPTLSIQALDGEPAEFPRSEEVLVFFFRPDCQYCKASLPTLRDALEDQCDFTLVLATSDSMEATRNFWDRYGWATKCERLVVGVTKDQTVPSRVFGISVVPTYLWIGRDGEVKGWKVGMLTSVDWRGSLQ